LVDGIAADANALGYFGYSYYDENRDRLKLVAVDNGNGCVEPNTETVARGLYQPLSRPLFIYVNKAHMETKDEISAFVSFYLANAPSLVDDVGYIPLTDQLYELSQARYDDRIPGSVFEGLGSTVASPWPTCSPANNNDLLFPAGQVDPGLFAGGRHGYRHRYLF
jgi:phosphate transport system substrate-binding protein